MDMTDIDKEIANLRLPQTKPVKRVDYSVRHADVKVLVSRALAVLFFLAIALFALCVFINAKNANIQFGIVAVVGIVYMALGAFVAYKLWNIEFIGWLALFYISLAGIALPAISAYSRGITVATIPIMAVSLVTLVVLWVIGDLYRVKKFRDIFRPPQ
jgi:ABC-type multidrug transport system permease subunit